MVMVIGTGSEAKKLMMRPIGQDSPVLDEYSGREASREGLVAGKTASIFFGIMVRYKQWKISEMERRGLDPNNVDDMKKVTIDDYKGKWYQFRRNAEQKILKNGSDAPK